MTKEQPKKENSPPIERIRIGLVQASIWKKQGEHRPFYEASFQRSYLDQEGNWRTSRSFSGGHLLSLAKAADVAHTRILALQEQEVPSEIPDADEAAE